MPSTRFLPVERSFMSEKEEVSNRRKSRRVTLLTLRYRVISGWTKHKKSKPVLGIIQNISSDGLCLKTNTLEVDGLHLSFDDTPLVRNKLEIDLDLPNSEKTIHITGEVEWYEKERGRNKDFYLVGVSFVKIREEDRRILDDYIEMIDQFTD